MGTKKSNKLYAAAAALAVTASAVAPGLTADAASKVTVKSITAPKSISHYGGYTFAVKKLSLPKTVKVLLSNKKYENRSVKWGKVSYDKKYIGKYQTISGTVSGTTKKASIKVKLNNYPVDVVEPKLAPVAVGEKLNLPSTIDVKYKDGKVIARSAKSFNLTAEKTDKAGEMKLSYNYMGKNSSIKGSIAYEVKAAEITNVMNEIKDDMLSVSADVKYPAKDAKAEVLVYAFKDMTKEPIKVAAELKDGKLTAKSAVLPAGTHAFAVKVGEVVSPAKDFVIEAPMVKEVKAINATQVEIAFNKAVDAKSVFTDGVSGALVTDVLKFRSIDAVEDGTLTGKLSADGKTLTVTSTKVLEKRYDVEVDKVKTLTGSSVEKFSKIITIDKDTVAPTILGTEKLSASQVKVKFSEPMKAFNTVTFKYADGSAVTNVSGEIQAGATEAVFILGDVTVGKEIVATFIGAQDQAGNLLTPNPATVSFSKGAADGVAPTVSSITQTGADTFAIKFSEALLTKPTVTLAGTLIDAAKVVVDEKDPTKYNVTAPAVLEEAKTVAVSSFTDLSGVAGVNESRVVTFVKDTVAPKVVSSNVVVDAKDKQEYLEIAFDKDVVVDNTSTVDVTSGSYVKDFVTTSIADGDITAKVVAYKTTDNKKVIRVALKTLLTDKDVKGAVYSLNLSFANVSSVAKIAAEGSKSSFTRGEDGVVANTDKVAVEKIAQDATNNSKVEVTFDKAVDGASATNVSNYRIDGAIVESVTLLPVKDDKQVAVLNLKADSNTFTGTRNITISNVKALGSSVSMDQKFVNDVSLKENVAPKVTSAKLTATDKLTLTFSESVLQAVTDKADFELLVGGKSYEVKREFDAGFTAATGTATVTITAVDADSLSKGLSLKALSTLDIKDAAGNVLSVPSNITVSN
ncbi:MULTISPECIES: Ig-like domain-containing protein [unclassified Exiguobacterium]|uniref:Ig-like domain-containing protein n=1 Tax=unclassified Exiguobacterium TaxID=2644629 RepID=UPI0020354384|nr:MULTISPECIES: Ig-like domain-containing protein [unclassified Exiguobacterium]